MPRMAIFGFVCSLPLPTVACCEPKTEYETCTPLGASSANFRASRYEIGAPNSMRRPRLSPPSDLRLILKTLVPKEENCFSTLASNDDVAVVMLMSAVIPSPITAMVSAVRNKLLRIDRNAMNIISRRRVFFMSVRRYCLHLQPIVNP